VADCRVDASTMKRSIFIAPIPRFDVESARDYGEICFLFPDVKSVNPFGGQDCLRRIAEAMEKIGFDSKEDSIGLSGPVPSVAMMVLAALELSVDGTISVLIFDARDGGTYRSRALSPDELVPNNDT